MSNSTSTLERLERVDETALAWVNAIRVRVKELVDYVDSVIHVGTHPQWTGAETVLRTAIRMQALGSLFQHLEDAERDVEELLVDDGIVQGVPALASTCREVAQELGLAQPEANS